jgi:hypothetical protein
MGVGPLISPSLIQLWIDMSRIKVFSLAVATFVIVCLVSALFGKPRPMSSAVMAEYDRQREKAGKSEEPHRILRKVTTFRLRMLGGVQSLDNWLLR